MALGDDSKATGLTMTQAERNRAQVIVIEQDAMQRSALRNALRDLGYGGVSDAPNHASALEKFEQRKFTHVIFDAKKSNMPPNEFLQKVLEFDSNVICIPSSFEPNVDDVFDLLIKGARGYLCKPFTTDSLEASIVMASKGEPIADAVLNAKDRNEALVGIMMHSLDKCATIMRQAQQFETAKREIPMAVSRFRTAAGLAQTFAKGGIDGLVDALEQFCIERSKGPATRLGRLRRRLKNKAGKEEEGEGEEQASA
ncbi:MAG: response regulator [Bdellovibrionales bacterium]|nr:response regulator [Bdellovibrionales bacterium]